MGTEPLVTDANAHKLTSVDRRPRGFKLPRTPSVTLPTKGTKRPAELLDQGTDGKPPDEADNANYFSEYGFMYHQMDMLDDAHRTGTYRDSMLQNPHCFEGKVVLDVGAGTCILSIMAAKAGARRVFAVEATDMAHRAKVIVEANGLADVIQVLHGTVETVSLPCKVDVIVSEWMGYFLLRESMLDSVIVARDKFLKEDGSLFPSHANLYLAPVSQVRVLRERFDVWEQQPAHWDMFSKSMRSLHGVDFSCMREQYLKEQEHYYLLTGAFAHLCPQQLCGPSASLLELDLRSVTLQELQAPTPRSCTLRITRNGPLEGFCGFFDVEFRGSERSPTERPCTLSTEPSVSQPTHWGQQVFGFYPPMIAKSGDLLECTVLIKRQLLNHRVLELEGKFVLHRPKGKPTIKDERQLNFTVD